MSISETESELLVVTTTADTVDPFDGETSLREALMLTNGDGYGYDGPDYYKTDFPDEEPLEIVGAPPGDADGSAPVITFAEDLAGETIMLSDRLEISNTVVIDGDLDGDGIGDITLTADGHGDGIIWVNASAGGIYGPYPPLHPVYSEGGFYGPGYGDYGPGYGDYGDYDGYRPGFRGEIDVTLNGLTITGNSSTDSEGYPGYASSAIEVTSSFYGPYGGPRLTDASIDGPGSYGPYGPGLPLEGDGPNVTISNSVITDNADSGTGTVFLGFGSSTTIVNTTISDNTSDVGYRGEYGPSAGGAITNLGVLTMVNSTIAGHDSTGSSEFGGYGYTAGAIFNVGFAGLLNTTIANTAATGGTIYNGGDMAIVNSTITGNTVTGLAFSDPESVGVIVNFGGYGPYSPGPVSGRHAYSGPYSEEDGAPIYGATLAIGNSIIAGNTVPEPETDDEIDFLPVTIPEFEDPGSLLPPPADPSIIVGVPIIDQGGNIIQSEAGTLFEALDDAGRPLLADNGGFVETVAIDADGDAADAGDSSILPPELAFGIDLDDDGDLSEVLPVDARGKTRETGEAVDAGAFELRDGPTGPAEVGTTGADTIRGGVTNDDLEGGLGDDRLNGGAGNDDIDGGEGDDDVKAGLGDDDIDAGIGNDFVAAGQGEDRVEGGEGNDRIAGQGGADIISGGDGEDQISGGAGNDRINGDDGNDDLGGGGGDDIVRGGNDDDDVRGGGGDDELFGDAGVDIVRGGEGDDDMSGGTGNDDLRGQAGDDTISGDEGDDKLVGAKGDDDMDGGEGEDTLIGGDGNDTLDGGADDDTLSGGKDNDDLSGGEGNDALSGGDGDDTLNGQGGNDRLRGQDGNDVLTAEGGEDDLRGDDGDDTLIALDGDHVLAGGFGNDTFVFSNASFGSHTVKGFGDGDMLTLDGFGFGTEADAAAAFSQVGKNTVFSSNGVTVTFERADVDDVLDAMNLIDTEFDGGALL